MSIANLSITIGSKSRGYSASEKSRYICRQGKHKNRGDLMHSSFGNMPKFAEDDPSIFWRAADKFERANAATYTEHTLTLPRALSLDQHIDLIEDWIKSELKVKAYQYAIHYSKSADGGLNPHAHLIFSEREQDGFERPAETFFKRYNSKFPERGGCKKGGTGSRNAKENQEEVKRQRERFEHLTNGHLERAKVKTKVSLRSYKDQGLLITPEPKLGKEGWRNWEKKKSILLLREQKEIILAEEKKIILLTDQLAKASADLTLVRETKTPDLLLSPTTIDHIDNTITAEITEALTAVLNDPTQSHILTLASRDLEGLVIYSCAYYFDYDLDPKTAKDYAQTHAPQMQREIAKATREHDATTSNSQIESFALRIERQETAKIGFNTLIKELHEAKIDDSRPKN